MLQLLVSTLTIFLSFSYGVKFAVKRESRLPNLSQPKFPSAVDEYDLIVLGGGTHSLALAH